MNETQTLTASESVFGIMAWLTTNKNSITFGSSHDASIAAQLAGEFCELHSLGEPSDTWPEGLQYPENWSK